MVGAVVALDCNSGTRWPRADSFVSLALRAGLTMLRGRTRSELAGADLDRLVDQASHLHPWMWVRGWGGGLLSGSRLGALIDEFVPVPSFEGLRTPVVVLATDVDSGEAVVFREGSVRDAVRASCSFPGVFPPFVWNGRRLVDGGVTEVVPVRLADRKSTRLNSSHTMTSRMPSSA